jgi:hypothetical protein
MILQLKVTVHFNLPDRILQCAEETPVKAAGDLSATQADMALRDCSKIQNNFAFTHQRALHEDDS